MRDQLMTLAIRLLDLGVMPDAFTRYGIRRLCATRLENEAERSDMEKDAFYRSMKQGEVAPVPEKANEQHYEVPAEFYELCLGKHRKYSCCFFENGDESLDEAEANALKVTCEHAQLEDGQTILELGCGWGSLTLWMAETYPNSRVMAVSNSHSQRTHIEKQAKRRGLDNLKVITCDMNDFEPDGKFDRIVSVEMFEHMRNYSELLTRVSRWLTDDGKLFVHIFCHQRHTYPFETDGPANWMGQHFFTGGIMPAEDIFESFSEQVEVVRQWRWNGSHYQDTANAWLRNLDNHKKQAIAILGETYGQDHARKWFNRWRVFFMACAELWGYREGNEWFVSHYLIEPRPATSNTLRPEAYAQETSVGV